jgi:hypothetical protein
MPPRLPRRIEMKAAGTLVLNDAGLQRCHAYDNGWARSIFFWQKLKIKWSTV